VIRTLTFFGLTAAVLLGARPGWAQTWVPPRTTPSILEIVAIDATGETPWPFGAEDIAGDGLTTFEPPEPSTDIRTAYAVATAQEFIVRVYVSDTAAVGDSVTVYVFIDADASAATGGSAAATTVDPALANDPSPGGYESVLVLRGDADPELFDWQTPMNDFQAATVPPGQTDAEAGQDLDPLRLGARQHGYVQARVDLGAVGLTPACDANLFVRSVDGAASPPGGDLVVGSVQRCVAAETNGVPAIVVPARCDSDAECPGGGVCVAGRCRLTAGCAADADCAADETCTDGWCVVERNGACTTTADCGDRVCDNGTCGPCTDDAACGDGRFCGPDGRCFAGPLGGQEDPVDLVDDDEDVQGGACACRAVGSRGRTPLSAALVLLALLGRRRGKRHAHRAG
jgi:hypothetical protein